MSMNQFIYFSFVDFSNATLNIERLTEYLASLKNRYLKKNIYILLTFRSFSLYCTCSVNVFDPVSLYSLC